MREFNQIEQFIKKYQENHEKSTFKQIKFSLLEQQQEKEIEQENKKNHEVEVVNQLDEAEWD